MPGSHRCGLWSSVGRTRRRRSSPGRRPACDWLAGETGGVGGGRGPGGRRTAHQRWTGSTSAPATRPAAEQFGRDAGRDPCGRCRGVRGGPAGLDRRRLHRPATACPATVLDRGASSTPTTRLLPYARAAPAGRHPGRRRRATDRAGLRTAGRPASSTTTARRPGSTATCGPATCCTPRDRAPVLIDPAAHGGHGLTDLAMLALFGTAAPGPGAGRLRRGRRSAGRLARADRAAPAAPAARARRHPRRRPTAARRTMSPSRVRVTGGAERAAGRGTRQDMRAAGCAPWRHRAPETAPTDELAGPQRAGRRQHRRRWRNNRNVFAYRGDQQRRAGGQVDPRGPGAERRVRLRDQGHRPAHRGGARGVVRPVGRRGCAAAGQGRSGQPVPGSRRAGTRDDRRQGRRLLAGLGLRVRGRRLRRGVRPDRA